MRQFLTHLLFGFQQPEKTVLPNILKIAYNQMKIDKFIMMINMRHTSLLAIKVDPNLYP